MVTLLISKLSDNLGFDGEDIQLKSASAAWNKIREIRDTSVPNELNGTILHLIKDRSEDKIPSAILFSLNKKGKIEFKNYERIKK